MHFEKITYDTQNNRTTNRRSDGAFVSAKYSLHAFAEIAQIEHVVRLVGSGQKVSGHVVVYFNCRLYYANSALFHRLHELLQKSPEY